MSDLPGRWDAFDPNELDPLDVSHHGHPHQATVPGSLPAVTDAFYVRGGEDRFVPTEWTRGPWSPNAQHAGPPAALVGRAFERLLPDDAWHVARFTFDVLRPVPLEPLTVTAQVIREGRQVRFVQGSLSAPDGEVARASAWLILRAPGSTDETNLEPPPFVGPDDSAELPTFDPWEGPSYFTAMEWRFAHGAFFEPGPSAAWMRMRVALVEGERPSPLSRVLVPADSANGISSEVPIDRFLFVNTELTVHLARMPEANSVRYWAARSSATWATPATPRADRPTTTSSGIPAAARPSTATPFWRRLAPTHSTRRTAEAPSTVAQPIRTACPSSPVEPTACTRTPVAPTGTTMVWVAPAGTVAGSDFTLSRPANVTR
ncbi:MAG TPA: hypothetical protein DIT48_01790 [Actinobacteria bacterium]|nr:hypothetical protein [Actinomycetota bacterium]